MNLPAFEDKLGVLGAVAGVYLLVTVVGMLAGQPWSSAEGSLVAVVQVVGILATAAVAVVLVLVARGTEIGELPV